MIGMYYILIGSITTGAVACRGVTACDPLGYTGWNFHRFPQKGQWLEVRLSTVLWSSRLGGATALQVGSLVKGFV